MLGDAAHFVYVKFSNYTWGKKIQYAPSGHGRYRINVYGAYDVVTNQVYSMYNKGYINADFMVEYLIWLRTEIYDDRSRKMNEGITIGPTMGSRFYGGLKVSF